MSTETTTPTDAQVTPQSSVVVGETTPETKTEPTAASTLYDKQAPQAPVEEKPPVTPPTPPSEEKKDEAKTEEVKKEDQQAEVKYELKLPENSLLSESAVAEIEAIAKENKLSPAAAQKMLERENNAVFSYHQKSLESLQQSRNSWVEAVKNDKELGGDNYKETAVLARRAMETFGDQELKDVFNSTGGGDHPAIVRFFKKVGAMIGEDKFVHGQNHSGKLSAAETLYGKS